MEGQNQQYNFKQARDDKITNLKERMRSGLKSVKDWLVNILKNSKISSRSQVKKIWGWYNTINMADFAPRRHRRAKHFLHIPNFLSFSNLGFWSVIVRLIFIGLILMLIVVPLTFWYFSQDLPSPGTLVHAKYGDATRIYDRNGVLLYSFYQNENRTYVTLPEISKYIKEGTIAIEDKNFYSNGGFSPVGYVRAIYHYIKGDGLGGASTITQQLVKNVLLNNQRTITRKIRELILSIQVNQMYTKDQILEMYLNNIPYGGTAIGVEAAAQQYFGKDANQLDIAQGAFISGLPQSPSIYSPFSGNKYYIPRTNAVLTQMYADGYITQSQELAGEKEIANYKFTEHVGGIKAPHFVMYVKQLLANQFGERAVESGGLQVTTTLDYNIENEVENDVVTELDKLKGYHVTNGAVIVTDPKTGAILAMDGSKNYFDTANDGNFNAALAYRQPGSSLKPIMYSVAFEHGYTPATLVMDVATDFKQTDSEPNYIPVNYDLKYRGPIQLRFALGNSINVPAVKMLARVGIEPVMQQAYDMGIANWKPTATNLNDVGYSLVLGGRETTLLQEVTAYGVFANQGIRINPYAIEKVTDDKGNVLYQHQVSTGQRVLPVDVCFLISHILLDNNARIMEFGAYSKLVVPGHTVSVKTGTTDNKRDNWTIGYTPSYVVGVWVGNNDDSPMNQAIASGITGAAPIWNDIMTQILKGKPDQQPQKPSDVVAVTIDAFAGGLPHPGEPTRVEYFINGTQPKAQSPVYESENGKDYFVFKESDPISTDGKNRWQDGINAWIQQYHKNDQMWNPPPDLVAKTADTTTWAPPSETPNQITSAQETPTPMPTGATPTPQPTDTPVPTPTPH